MRLHLHCEVTCAWERPVPYSIRTLRLTPRSYDGLAVESWLVRSDRSRAPLASVDGLGNVTHLDVVREPHDAVTIVAEGVVEIRDARGVVTGAREPMPPSFYLRPTALTAQAPALAALADEAARAGAAADRVHALLALVHDRVVVRTDPVDAARLDPVDAVPTAAEVLARGGGAARDLAHVLVATARLLGLPARCVGGYVLGGPEPTSHAWAEVHVPDLGWLGVDPAIGACPHDRHVGCAVGPDHPAAAPVRGSPRPGGDPNAAPRIVVAAAQQQ